MPIARIGYGTDFILKNQGVGVATDTTDVKLEVGGTTKANYNISGIASLSNYAGFAAAEQSIDGTVTLTGEHSTLGDIVVGLGSTSIISTGATVCTGTVESISLTDHFSPPCGYVDDRPECPVEGTVRFNKDLNTLEFYNGAEWRQFTVNGQRGRGIIFGGFEPGIGHVMIQQFEVSTLGNTTSFGDLIESTYSNNGGCSSETRGLTAGSGPGSNTIQYITIASSGNSINFGDTSQKRGYISGTSSSTRGIWAGGYAPSPVSANVNTIDYAQISTLGDAADFGDLTSITNITGACASPTRAVFGGGSPTPPTLRSTIDYITIAAKGNAHDFGDMTNAFQYCAHSNTTRGIFMGKHNGTDSLTIATGGNAQHFADLSQNTRQEAAVTGSMTRCVIGGGYTLPGYTNSMEYVTISTEGSAADFGDMMSAITSTPTCSDSHGGLGGY